MKLNPLKILLIISISLFIIFFPYTKEVKIFKAKDVNWDIINQSRTFKEFDPVTFSFMQKYEFSEEILNLDNSIISIKGFIKNHKHIDHKDIILTETVTDVCFMCDHDEHYNMIHINSLSDSLNFLKLTDDTYINIQGVFNINKSTKNHPVFGMSNVVLKEILN